MPLSAVQVPCWADVLLLAARSHNAIPLGYFGIDIVIDAQLGPVILELNARPGLSIQLANHRGLRQVLEELCRQRVDPLAASERVVLGREIVSRTRTE
jgi:predicted ATP-grasp superfamily ATP-dependent carboligase